MLKKLTIQNFQSHEKTVLELDKGINVIHGLSQAGKTAILRALNWIVFNRPSGFRFHSNFSDEPTKVTVDLDDTQISYKKTDKSGVYKIGDEKFSSFGQSIPIPIKDKFNLSPLNFANQLDPLFLITSSPGEVGRKFNEITKAEQVDQWISKLTTEINKANSALELNQKEVDELNLQIGKLKKLDKIQPWVDRYLKYQERMKGLEESIEEVSTLYSEYQNVSFLIESIPMKRLEKYSSELFEVFDGISKHEKMIKNLIEFEKKSKEIEEYKTILKKTEKDFEELSGLIDKQKDLISAKQSLISIQNILMEINELKKEIQHMIKTFSVGLKKFGRCPLCFSEIDLQTIKRIEKEI